ncbi:MAG: cytidylate kinase-like family protein [Clostridia bacterium]|nr:cytidylate kinase-like family protein [Clostridia bacterium]
MRTIITISRQYGSGGREIGALIAEKLGIPFYDNALIQKATEASGFSSVHFEDVEKNARNSFLYSIVRGIQYHNSNTGIWSLEDSIYMTQAKVIRELAEKGSCVIVGRCSDYILADDPDLIKVFVYAPLEARAKHCIQRDGLEPDKAIEIIKGKDKRRQNYYNYHADTRWGEVTNYHICLDSSFTGIEAAADAVVKLVQNREKSE